MPYICIELCGDIDIATENLMDCIKKLCKLKITKYNVNTRNNQNSNSSNSIILKLFHSKKTNLENIIKYNRFVMDISDILANYIITKYQPLMIQKLINSYYSHLNNTEKEDLLNYVLERSTNAIGTLEEFSYTRKKNIIIRLLLEYFKSNNIIALDGFVTFRLKSYVNDLEDWLQILSNDFLVEKEYNEFINLLKYFVNSQTPKCNSVHLVFDEHYILFDDDMNKICNNNYTKDSILEVHGKICDEDLLISTLVTLSPKKITIHGIEMFYNKDIINTIKSIFPDKIILCNGCDFCMCKLITSDLGETLNFTIPKLQ